MKYLFRFAISILVIFLIGCELVKKPMVEETAAGYQIQKGTDLSVILQTPLSSNVNRRGDTFSARLKEPLIFKGKTILPKDAKIMGLVKTVTKFEKLGDRASLVLLFDQVVLPEGRKIPLVASLDTERGTSVIKIRDKEVKDATVIVGSGVVGALVGKETLGKNGAQKGLIIGAGAGTGAVMLSNMKEIKLPQGTELIIRLDETLLIPKKD